MRRQGYKLRVKKAAGLFLNLEARPSGPSWTAWCTKRELSEQRRASGGRLSERESEGSSLGAETRFLWGREMTTLNKRNKGRKTWERERND